jgi:hypothetical protein
MPGADPPGIPDISGKLEDVDRRCPGDFVFHGNFIYLYDA